MPNSIHIGNVIRHAHLFNFKRQHRNTMNTDALLQAVVQLFALLEERQVAYVLVGGVAILQYIQGRNTEDIDLILSISDLQKLPEITIVNQDNNFARGMLGALQIDCLLTSNPLFRKVQQQYVTPQSFQERVIPCATIEGLLLLKLYALPSLYRQGDFIRVGLYENDIATLLHEYRPALDAVLAELRHHLSTSDLVALREVVAEIQQRLARFQRSFRN